MIRMRSAFMIMFIAVLLAFSIGVQAGYYASRSATLAEGMERWVEEVKTSAKSAADYVGQKGAELTDGGESVP
ncbi:MAG: hypothetical protein LBG12_06455 [Synergistaceae bacterium]|jgi:membrane protein implicated in regulation of membrane protease activity|nr:hypothetical protein [Synergistaceae bacterium]